MCIWSNFFIDSLMLKFCGMGGAAVSLIHGVAVWPEYIGCNPLIQLHAQEAMALSGRLSSSPMLPSLSSLFIIILSSPLSLDEAMRGRETWFDPNRITL